MKLLLTSVVGLTALTGAAVWAQDTAKPSSSAEGVEMAPAYQVLKPRWKAMDKIGGAYSDQGPRSVDGGQAPNTGPDSNIIGAIESIVAHPTDPDQVWIAAVNGGIWKTDNATDASPTWVAQTDGFASQTMGHMSLDPADTTDPLTLLAGFGTQSSYGGVGSDRLGLLRTTDGGSTWSLVAGFPANRSVSGIAADGSTIVVAVNSAAGLATADMGVFRSTDSGTTFTQVSVGDGTTTGLPNGRSNNLAQNPLDPTELYVDIELSVSGTNGIYRSTDTGASWTKVSDAAIDAFFPSVGNLMISVGEQGTGATSNVFVGICGGGSLSAVFRSGDSGGTWTSLDLPSTSEIGSPGLHPGGQCSIHFSMAADPNDDDVVFIGGDRQPDLGISPFFPNNSGGTTYSGRVFRIDASASPGSQATPATDCPSATPADCDAQKTATGSGPHADSRFMVFDANDDLLESDDGGIYRKVSPNVDGASATDWVSMNGNLGVKEQHDVAYDTTSNIVFSGNQDNGTTTQSMTGSTAWDSTFGGDGGDVTVAAEHPMASQSTRYISFQNDQGLSRWIYDSSGAFVSGSFGNVSRSNPGGGCSSIGSGFFRNPRAINAIDGDRIILAATNGLFESSDQGDTVCDVSGVAPNNFLGGPMLAYGATGNADVIYYVANDDVLVRTAAAPAAFTTNDPDGGSSSDLRGVVIDPSDPTAAYAIGPSNVYQTTNSGASWTDITDDLFTTHSPGQLYSITYVESGSGDGVVVGAQLGVYVVKSNQGFTGWEELGTGLPNALVFDMQYDASDDILTVGTMGRGFTPANASNDPGTR